MNTLAQSTLSLPAKTRVRGAWTARVHRLLVRLRSPARYDRLEGSLRIAQIEIERRPDSGEEEAAAGWKDSALQLLASAEGGLQRGKIDQGWKFLHAARRGEILGMQRHEVAARTTTLRAEAEKIKSWRQRDVRALVGTLEQPLEYSGTALVIEAAQIRDDHYDNQGYKDELVRKQILSLVWILAVVLTAIMSLSRRGSLSQAPPLPLTLDVLLAVMLFGNLGGTISSMLRVSDTTSSTRIPELTAAVRVTFMRILMGGASAVVIHLALQSQLSDIFARPVAEAVRELTLQTACVVAFVAGFSERLVLQAVEYIAGNPSDASDKGKIKEKT